MGTREVLLLLGGNEGDLHGVFSKAEVAIGNSIGTIRARSRDHWTEPWGFDHKDLFLNIALLVESELPPDDLMAQCLAIERSLGRIRSLSAGYGPRPIDIDILLIGAMVHASETVQIPHPRMHQRRFALSPAADIAPLWIHPTLHTTILALLNGLR